jgi:hypothetical protein
MNKKKRKHIFLLEKKFAGLRFDNASLPAAGYRSCIQNNHIGRHGPDEDDLETLRQTTGWRSGPLLLNCVWFRFASNVKDSLYTLQSLYLYSTKHLF